MHTARISRNINTGNPCFVDSPVFNGGTGKYATINETADGVTVIVYAKGGQFLGMKAYKTLARAVDNAGRLVERH